MANHKNNRLQVMLDNLDYKKITDLVDFWEELSVAEKFFSFLFYPLIHDIHHCKKTLENKRQELQELHFFNIFFAYYELDTSTNFHESLHKVITSDLSKQNDDLIIAEFNALLGYIFICQNNFLMAKEFYKSAKIYHDKKGVSSLAWKYKNNIFICDLYIKDGDPSLVVVNELLEEFWRLNLNVQIMLSKIFSTQLSYTGHFDHAVNVIQRSLTWVIQQQNFQEADRLFIYLYYFKKISNDDSSNSYSLNSDTHYKLELIQSTEKANFESLKEILLDWDKNLNFSYKYMLSDLLFWNLLKHKRYLMLLKLFSFFEKNILSYWSLAIPPRSIFASLCLALAYLGKDQDIAKYLLKSEKTSRKNEHDDLLKSIQKIKLSKHSHLILIDFSEKTIECQGNLYLFNKKTKSFLLLNLIYDFYVQGERKISFEKICFYIPGTSIDTIGGFLKKTFTSINMQFFFLITKDELLIKKGTILKRKNKPQKQMKNREKTIIELLHNSKEGMTSALILRHLKCSKKTLINDLNALLKEGKINRQGLTRSILYTTAIKKV